MSHIYCRLDTAQAQKHYRVRDTERTLANLYIETCPQMMFLAFYQRTNEIRLVQWYWPVDGLKSLEEGVEGAETEDGYDQGFTESWTEFGKSEKRMRYISLRMSCGSKIISRSCLNLSITASWENPLTTSYWRERRAWQREAEQY